MGEAGEGVVELREYAGGELAGLLPVPARDANKYSRGKLVALVGSARYPGAACLAAAASQRMGAGYTEVITHPAAVGIVRAWRPSLVVRSQEDWSGDGLASSRPKAPLAYLVGCGFDAAAEETEALTQAVLEAAAPVLVDGGALSALASEGGRLLLRQRFVRGWSTVATPHGGEAARLARALDLPVGDPARLARALSLAFGVTVALKGPETFVSDGEQVVRIGEGTPALAKAGTGDVLAGMIGALLAQGMGALDAAVLGVALHARAGRAAERALTSISATAEDVLDAIPAAIREAMGA